MTLDSVMAQLAAAGNERTKKNYLSRGAKEPLFGVTVTALKPIAKPLMGDKGMADALYATGNYDAMYLAGMIVPVQDMTEGDFERWMDGATCAMVGDYTVSVVLAESPLAEAIADKWIASGQPLRVSAGYQTYNWRLGCYPDKLFDQDKILRLLEKVRVEYAASPEVVQEGMSWFLAGVGASYAPLHIAALEAARTVGDDYAVKNIEQLAAKGKIGFKRKALRC